MQSQHIERLYEEGDQIRAGDVVGYLHWESGNIYSGFDWPHIHTKVMFFPNGKVNVTRIGNQDYIKVIDMFNPEMHIGGTPEDYPCGLFICETLPEQVRKLFERNFFDNKANYDD